MGKRNICKYCKKTNNCSMKPSKHDLALTGLRRLLKNGDFTNTISTDEMRETYQRLASPIAAFVMDWIQINPGMYIAKDDLYHAFCDYCNQNFLPLVAKNIFSMKLHEYVRIRDYRGSIEGKRVQCWMGIGMSEMSKMSGCNHILISQVREREYDIKIEEYPDNPDNHDKYVQQEE